ncbi:hypothetical protein [Halorussus marinus]|uniref:hypothetical protein n=1 Tax=Halorussus marinus TaxID=2505976 RepID=UPI00106E95FC|nr:hypothetical protein [Halorussus marinus]
MKSVIFTEGSSTTSETTEDQLVRGFFQGGFLSVAALEESLAEYGETEIQILSEEYGHIQGSQKLNELSEQSVDSAESFESSLHSAASEADVIVILLTTSTFDSIVKDTWDTLMNEAESGSIWCIGASKSALSSIDFSKLEQKDCDILTYERVGVARIGSETRERLLAKVESRTPQKQ